MIKKGIEVHPITLVATGIGRIACEIPSSREALEDEGTSAKLASSDGRTSRGSTSRSSSSTSTGLRRRVDVGAVNRRLSTRFALAGMSESESIRVIRSAESFLISIFERGTLRIESGRVCDAVCSSLRGLLGTMVVVREIEIGGDAGVHVIHLVNRFFCYRECIFS